MVGILWLPLLSVAELLMSPVMKEDSCFLTVSFHIRLMRLCTQEGRREGGGGGGGRRGNEAGMAKDQDVGVWRDEEKRGESKSREVTTKKGKRG